MFDLDCKVCFKSFDLKERLPRIFNCGHTFCSECISTLLKSSNSCPNCMKIIAKDANSITDSFIINYFILQMTDSSDQIKENFVENSFKMLTKLKSDYSKLRTTLESEKEKLDINLITIKDGEKSLEEMMKEFNPFERKHVEEMNKIKKNYEDICKQATPAAPLLLNDVSMQSINYDSTALYLTEIYKGILAEKRFAAVLIINGVRNYAKLSVRDNFLFIHSFEKTKMEDVTTVCFEDIVDKILREKTKIFASSTTDPKISAEIYGFLDLTYGSDGYCRRVVIDILSSASDLGSQFIKYCSGEEGCSYKGSTYDQRLGDYFDKSQQTNVKVDKLIQLRNKSRNDVTSVNIGLSRYFQFKNDTAVTCNFGTYYLRLEVDGSFEILRFRLSKTQSNAREKLFCKPKLKAKFDTGSSSPNSVVNFGDLSSCPKLETNIDFSIFSCDPESIPTFGLPSSNPIKTVCDQSPPKLTKIVATIVDLEMNIHSTFAEAKVRNILDCGIAIKM